jgi:hypothetical protein
MPSTRRSASPIEETSIATSPAPACTISRSSAWITGASGVVCSAFSFTLAPPGLLVRFPVVPITPAFHPCAWAIASSIHVTDVFPLVPVTPITGTRCDGWPGAPRRLASALRASGDLDHRRTARHGRVGDHCRDVEPGHERPAVDPRRDRDEHVAPSAERESCVTRAHRRRAALDVRDLDVPDEIRQAHGAGAGRREGGVGAGEARRPAHRSAQQGERPAGSRGASLQT